MHVVCVSGSWYLNNRINSTIASHHRRHKDINIWSKLNGDIHIYFKKNEMWLMFFSKTQFHVGACQIHISNLRTIYLNISLSNLKVSVWLRLNSLHFWGLISNAHLLLLNDIMALLFTRPPFLEDSITFCWRLYSTLCLNFHTGFYLKCTTECY